MAGVLAISSFFAQQAGAKPSEQDIKGVVQDVATLDELVKDITPAETAAVVLRVIKSIDASRMSDAEKKRAIAMVVARAVAYKPEQAAEMIVELVSIMKNDALLPTVAAAAVIAAEGNSTAVIDALTARFKNDKALLQVINDAANEPAGPLTPPVVKDIQDMVREMRLAAVPLVPAQEPTTAPLVPPLVGGKYEGQ